MFFSIIIPVYQVAPYLRCCLDSVTGQRFRDREILLVDDGSTDGSGAICDEYREKHPDIRVIHQQNQGLSGARNAGLDAAKGEWILFIDSDDWIAPDMLETLFAEMQRHPADEYGFNLQKANERGEMTEKLLFVPEHTEHRFADERQRFSFYEALLLRYRRGWEACGRVFRRAVIEEHHLRFQPTREVLAEDLLFTAEYSLYIRNYFALCHVFYIYRQREASLVHSVTADTVLPRVFRLSLTLYSRCKALKLRYFVRHFYRLCFAVMNYQIQYTLMNDPPSADDAAACMRKNPGRRWLKEMKKNRPLLEKEMVFVKWL